MDEQGQQLKTHHKFVDCLYWVSAAMVPFITACIGISNISIIWTIMYIFVFIAVLIVVYRFFCTHCPHYIKSSNTTKCMFIWGVPKFFKPRPGPLKFIEKAVSLIAPIILVCFPFYWLFPQKGLLVIYILSLAVFIAALRRYECGRCIYFHCPVNNVPEEVRRRMEEAG